MTTTLNLPDDLASAVQRRAAAGGHDVAAEVLELVRKGLTVSEAAGASQPVAKNLPVIKARPAEPGDAKSLTAQQMSDFIKDIDQQDEIERYERAFGHQYVDRARP